MSLGSEIKLSLVQMNSGPDRDANVARAAAYIDQVVETERSDLVVIPHGFLHHIPFHALFDGERYLADYLALSYAPSASVFQLCSSKQVAPQVHHVDIEAD